jgi:hypothetical protein
MKHVNVTQWVRGNSSPTRPTASHPVGSRTEERVLKSTVRSRGEARTQAASSNSEKCIMVDKGQGQATGPKADDMQTSEGSSPVGAKASRQDTTGV